MSCWIVIVIFSLIQVIAERKPPSIKRQNTFTIDADSSEKRAKTEVDMDGARGAKRSQQTRQLASHGRRSGVKAAKPQSSLTADAPRTRNGENRRSLAF